MAKLLSLKNITTALPVSVTDALKLFGSPRNLVIQGNFAGGTGGSAVDGYVQTSLDGGATWADIAQFHFVNTPGIRIYNLFSGTPKTAQVTPTDGSMTANTSLDGVLGPQFRVKYSTTGTYSGNTSFDIDVSCDQVA